MVAPRLVLCIDKTIDCNVAIVLLLQKKIHERKNERFVVFALHYRLYHVIILIIVVFHRFPYHILLDTLAAKTQPYLGTTLICFRPVALSLTTEHVIIFVIIESINI